MKERIPPLQGLYYFYIAADKKSFKKAAEHLYVTAAAISQQIRQLERYLDCDLFVREHRKVKLTPAGQSLYSATKLGFTEIQDALRKLNQDPAPNRLAISAHPTFAQHWLIPRIKEFRTQNPQLSLLIDPSYELTHFEDEAVDISVRYGDGHYPHLDTQWLMDEILYPVCHPSYQEEHKLLCLGDLTRVELIEDLYPDMNWDLWFKRMSLCSGQASLQYDGSQFVMEAALSAQGVALVKHSLAYRYLHQGQLVRIGNKAVKSKFSYYLCAPKGTFHRDKVRRFVDWMSDKIVQFKNEDGERIDLLNLPNEPECVIDISID